MTHSSVGPSPAEPDPWPVPAPLHGHVGSRFGEVRSLGPSATLGRAFRALDRQEKQQVVLRYLPDTDRPTATGEALHRQLAADPNERPPGFFRESLGEPRREGRVVLRGFVEGRALAEHLDRAPLPLTDALELLEAIAADLERAHDLGVLHGNLTPSNIVVPGERFGDATVVDYGLRPVVRDPETLEDVDRPLARYVSPEHAGLIDEEPGPAADLYLVGLVFYHALAGRFPYEGDDVGSLLRAHVTEEPEPIRRMRPQLPRAVDQVLDRLLRPDPAERYRSAKGLLADVRELRDRLAGAERDHPFVVGTQEERDTLARPGFLDRETELAALEDQTAATARGQGGLAKIEAVSGGGKTRLIREFLERSPLGGIQLLQAQVHEAVAQRPFQAVREVVHAVADRCERDATEARRLTEALGDHVAAVCEAFPPLADALGVDPPSSLGPDEYGEERTLAALSRFIDAIGTAEEPALVIVDDAQWADELTLRLLRRWARSDPPEGARYTTVVVAFRSDEVPGDAILREAEASLDLALDLFTDEQVRDLARSMAGPLPEDALDVLTRLAEGNPFMTTAVLRGLIESQALVHEDGRWRIREHALDTARASQHASGFLHQRLEHLPGPSKRLLTGAAVLGKTFDPDLAAALVDLPADEAQVPLEQAVERRMLWVDETTDGDRYAFVHDKLRETLLDRLDPERRRRFHLEAAERIEIESPGAVYELAYHFHAAGEPERALPYALPAAQRARDRYALETAETYYRIAADGVASTDRDARLEIHGGLGETLILAGRYEDAEEALEPARELARTEEEIAEIEGKLGELAFKRGDMVQAVDASQRALNALGERIPSWTLTYVLSILWETLIQITHSLAPSLTVGRRTPDEADLLTVRQYTRLAYASWFTKGTIPTLWAHLRELNLSERYPPTAERAQAYATHAPLMTQLPWFSRGERYANRGIEVAERLNDPYREGVARHFRGLVRYGASQYHAALETLHEAEHLLRQTGDRWEANTAGFHIAFCLYRLGRLDEAAEKAQDVHEQARRIGDRSNVGLAVEVWAKATDGALPRDVVEAAIEATPASDGQTLEAAYQALGLRELRDEDPEAALEAFERAAELRDSADLRSEYVAPIPCWRATALRRWAETVDDRTPHRRAALLDRAAEAARRATRTAFLYANNRPHAYRERGLIAALKGRSWWARYWLDKSLDTAEEQSAAAERARTLRARAELAEELGWSDVEETDFEPSPWQRKAREPRADAEADEPTLSLVERFSALLDEGREIATGLSEEEICTSVHEAALGLLRGTHCAILEPPRADGRLTHVHGDRELPVQEALVRRALDEDRIVCQPGDDLGGDEAAMASETPSVLVAPIRVDGEPSFALYVAHDEIRGLFGETERRLASFITAIGGAALENAVNVQELAELNQRLEEKVDERTAELETRLDQQARVATLGRDALAMEDPDSLIDRVCRVVQDTLGVTAATVLELEPGQERIRLRGTAGWELPGDGPVVAELGQGSQAGYTIDEDGPVVSGDLPEEDRFDPHPLLLEEGIRSSVSVPIPGRDGSWGVLGAHVREPAAITPDDANFVQAVANVLGAGLQHHQARRKLEEHARELEHANEDLRQFAYVASHDLREPIRMVSSYVQLLESRYGDQLDDEAKEMIEYAVEGAQRLHELIKGLLTYSRVDQGASQAVDVDLNVLVDEVRQSLQHQIDRSDATIHVDELPEVHVDRSQISQVLQNLLSNAMKFRRPDVPPVVEVSAEREPDAWRISVADNGVGLDPERAERLFEIFQRGQQRGEYDGQGVGLAVCKKIVGRHGGDIWVDSDGEAGSTFHVLLPDPEAREGQADAGLPETTRADTIPDEDD